MKNNTQPSPGENDWLGTLQMFHFTVILCFEVCPYLVTS